jgi:hypothetical protein
MQRLKDRNAELDAKRDAKIAEINARHDEKMAKLMAERDSIGAATSAKVEAFHAKRSAKKELAESTEPMRTAQEMHERCKAAGFGSGLTEKSTLEAFKIIEANLLPGEDVHMVFVGLHNFISATKHNENFAFAISDRRILMGQHKILNNTFQAILLDHLNDITLNTGIVYGTICFDTIKETFNVGVDKLTARSIFSRIQEAAFKPKTTPAIQSSPPADSTDELRKYKALLDDGLITADEYNAKKRQLLGL